MGSKGIGVTPSGTLEMHGKQYFPTWTRLAAHAYAGNDVIYVQEDINWEVGQYIVIITSVYEDLKNNQNEVRQIKAINGRYGRMSYAHCDWRLIYCFLEQFSSTIP